MVAVSPTVRRLSLIVTSTVGRRVSMLKLPLLGVPDPALPCASRMLARFRRMGLLAFSGSDRGVEVAVPTLLSGLLCVSALSVPLLVSYWMASRPKLGTFSLKVKVTVIVSPAFRLGADSAMGPVGGTPSPMVERAGTATPRL